MECGCDEGFWDMVFYLSGFIFHAFSLGKKILQKLSPWFLLFFFCFFGLFCIQKKREVYVHLLFFEHVHLVILCVCLRLKVLDPENHFWANYVVCG